MALITHFAKASKEKNGRRHTEVQCTWTIVNEDHGRLLQLDTFGSSDRQIPGKTSQTMQFDEMGSKTLLGILREVFPGI